MSSILRHGGWRYRVAGSKRKGEMIDLDRNHKAQAGDGREERAYEPPQVKVIGSIEELTRREGLPNDLRVPVSP
jgi:hypothetical protein